MNTYQNVTSAIRLINLALAAVTPIVEIITKIIVADTSTQKSANHQKELLDIRPLTDTKFLSPSEMAFENVVIIIDFMKAHRRPCPDVPSGLDYVVIF